MSDPIGQKKDRADRMLVALGHFESRASAQAAILAGGVVVDGAPLKKPSQIMGADARVDARPAHPYVSRGGLKLAHALDVFGVDPAGRTCLDIGASTGGFTEVLLERGAARVVAVDVGQDQLHTRLRSHPGVVVREATDARHLTRCDVCADTDLVVCDASFIALEKLLAGPLALLSPGADLIALFKPQFQVGRAHVGRRGIVTDHEATDAAAASLSAWLGAQGWPVTGWTDSPILGGDGNRERLLHARRL